MTLKTSLFNKGLIVSDIKRFWWVSALYTLLLFFILPLRHMMQKSAIQEEWIRNQIRYSLTLNPSYGNFQSLLILVVPVILAVLVFRYMQKNNAAAMMHSLPYTRKDLYCSHSAAGLLLLILPMVFNGLVLIILQATTNLGTLYSLIDILEWAGQTLIFSILFFSVTVFVGMFTGSSIAQMVFAYILQILPAGVYVLFRHNIGQLIHGYGVGRLYDPILENLPIFALFNGSPRTGGMESISIWNVTSYMLIAIALMIIGYYVYKIRNMEVAGDVIAFKSIRPVFKYGVTVCSMLLGGIYFTSIAGGNFPTLIFGYVLSSFLGYWIAEILMEKSFKVLGAYKGYVVYTVIMLMVLLGIQTDVTGYVGRVPDAEEVETVYLGYHGEEWVRAHKGIEKMRDEDGFLHYFGGYTLESRENIENIIALHEELVQRPAKNSGIYQYIVYGLKNGQYLQRYYLIDEEGHAEQLRPIYESLEYKEARFAVLGQREEDIKWIEISDDRAQKKSVMLTDSSEIQGFITALQKDIKSVDYEYLTTNRSRSVRATILDNNERAAGYPIRSQNFHVEQWLKDQGYYEEVVLMPEDVEYIVLEKTNSTHPPRRLEVRDRAVIEELIDLSTELGYNFSKQNVMVGFYMTGTSRHNVHTDYMQVTDTISNELRGYINQLDE